MRVTCTNLWPQLRFINEKFSDVPHEDWTDSVLKDTTSAIADTLWSSLKETAKETYRIVQFYLRWAIARGGSGPAMHMTMALLGRDTCLQRLDELAAMLESKSQKAIQSNSC